MNIREALKAILSKSMTAEEVYALTSPALREDLETSLAYIAEMNKSVEKSEPVADVMKFDKNGQWKMEKGSLDYGKINPRQNASVNPAAKKLADGGAAASEAAAGSVYYGEMNKPSNQKATWKQTSTPQSKQEAWTKINAQRSAMSARGLKKTGVLIDEEVKNPERMIAKNEMLGYGPTGTPSSSTVMQSEKEPHKDDPHHEEKEKKKAKKIKQKAQELLDMHKKEENFTSETKNIEGQDVKVKVYPPQKSPDTLDAKPTRSVSNVYGANYGKNKTASRVKTK